MKIATWNVNGIRARHAQLVEWVQQESPDVLCLQELKATPAQIPDPLTTLREYWSYWHGGPKGYSGVSLHLKRSRFPSEPRFEHPAFDHEYRIVTATAGGIVWASVYIPNGGKDYDAKVAFLRQMERWAGALHEEGKALILAGDMNVALEDRDVHPKERKPSGIGQRSDERAIFRMLIGHGLVDVARAKNPDDDAFFTWWAPWRQMREKNIGWRIDYVLASEALAAAATSARVQREVGTSDHGPLIIDFDETPFVRDPARPLS
jgi:exodeoxyribonuclease-3